MGRNDSESPPARRRGSPSRRIPSHRERSPARQRSSHGADNKPLSRSRSPKRLRSRSSESRSPVREKISTRNRSPKCSHSPTRDKTSGHRKSPKRPRATSPESLSPKMEKGSGRARSPRLAKSRSPKSRSPSPRTRRLMRVQAVKEAEREHDKNHGRGGDRSRQREKDSDKHEPIERRKQRSGRDSYNNGSLKSRHERSASPSDRSHRHQHRSRSPAVTNSRERDEGTHTRGDDHRNDDNDDSLAKMKEAEEALQAKEKVQEKPSFELSGKLAAETNRVRGITLLFNEPPDARKPDVRWRLYVLKNGEVLNDPLYVHRQSCYLFGRERRVADIGTDHPSCSKQHAVLQYRQVEKENPDDGTLSKQVRPYIMDLGSTNGTFINDNRIEPQRYYELLEKDTIKFGNSSREYVLLHENSA